MATENKYKYTRAYFKIRDLILNNPEENVFVIRGGQGAAKTISIIQLIIQSLVSSEKEATILSSELAKMKRTVVRDYKKVCKDWGVLQNDADFNKSESKHEYPNGSYLDFLGADVNDVGKGFRRDLLYINEADKMGIETAVQFISRAGLTIIDYNPDSLFWGDDYINENNFITLTFEDNEYLPESEVKSILEYKQKGFFDGSLPIDLLFKEENIKNKYWANKWRVYGLGMVGSLDGVVFSNWEIIDNVPPESKYVKSGVDFGYTNDPTTIIDKYLIDSIPVYDEALYRKGLVNSEIARELKSFKRNAVADSAEPKSIQEIRNHGIVIKGAEKGRDSIMFGVQNIQRYDKFYVTRRSVHLIEELQKYTWAKDRNGNTLNVPIDGYNHCFVGETLITTLTGYEEIKNIKEGDYVLTPMGYKKVLKKWNNGLKKVNEYSMLFDINSLSLMCTENHLIKTKKEWKRISQLKRNVKIYQHKFLEERLISYMIMKNILVKELKDFIGLFGNTIKVKSLKDIIYIILMAIPTITKLKILHWFLKVYILSSRAKNDLKIIKNGLITFIKKELNLQKNGIKAPKVSNGISNKQLTQGSGLGIYLLKTANNVIQGLSQKRITMNFAQTNVNHHLEEIQELMMLQESALVVEKTLKSINTKNNLNAKEVVREVFDLMVEDVYCYFANGILVHNCIDPIRYIEEDAVLNPKTKIRSSGVM